MSEPVLHSWNGGVLEITLNRPDRFNSFNDEMHVAMAECFDVAERDDACRAVLLTGAGRGFCAGQDLDARNPEKMSGPPDLGETLTRFYNPMIRRIRTLEKPVVCAVNGVAAGAGANLALACDIVLAASSAKFIQSFVRVGLVPDAGGSWMLPRLIGEARAKAIAMTAEPVPAEKAEAWGMIWRTWSKMPTCWTKRAPWRGRLAAGPTFRAGPDEGSDPACCRAGPRPASRHGSRDPARGRLLGRLRRGRARVSRKARAEVRRAAMSAISDQERAERSSEAMLRDDHTTKGFGMKIEAVGPGRATMSMVVRKDHLNGHGTCHGGRDLHAGRQRLRLCLQQPQQDHRGAALLGDLSGARPGR
jgi:2-(1,2-epoxy-1,2-dihydrophenyl)acetyl-CoA isomerase